MEDAFGRCHPVICFTFFIAAVVFGMVFFHPAFLAVSLAFSSLYYLLLKGREGLGFLGGMLAFIVVLTLLNPLFNTSGKHVLFYCFGTRAYTLEAMGYGAAIATMFASVLIWFGCYNQVMSSDKFTYLFARFAPSLSLVFTMVLRLVPNYQRQANTISDARKCVGKGSEGEDRKNSISNSMTVLSSLTSWALEGAIVTGDSMRSRGYGVGRRSSFAIYRMTSRDMTLLAVLAAAIVSVIVCGVSGAAYVQYTPTFEVAPFGASTVLGLVSYAVLLAVPSAVHIWEEATWRISRSRI